MIMFKTGQTKREAWKQQGFQKYPWETEVVPITQGSTENVDVSTVCSCTGCFLVPPFSSSLGEKLPGAPAVHLQQTALRSTSRGFDLAEEF